MPLHERWRGLSRAHGCSNITTRVKTTEWTAYDS